MRFPGLSLSFLLGAFLIGAGSGCGERRRETPPPKPTPPIAIKTIHFGCNTGEVERFFQPLEKKTDAFGLAVYSYTPEHSDTIARYLFEFVDGKLATVYIVYHAPAFDKLIGCQAFFRKLQKKYDVIPDVGAGQGLWRWFNVKRHITITWQQNFRKKLYTLTIRWNTLDAKRKKHYEQMRRARKQKHAPRTPAAPKADLGF